MTHAEPLIDYIKREHGTQLAYAEHINKSPVTVNRWVKGGNWMINGVMYTPTNKGK
jgi:hypothetical protein